MQVVKLILGLCPLLRGRLMADTTEDGCSSAFLATLQVCGRFLQEHNGCHGSALTMSVLQLCNVTACSYVPQLHFITSRSGSLSRQVVPRRRLSSLQK